MIDGWERYQEESDPYRRRWKDEKQRKSVGIMEDSEGMYDVIVDQYVSADGAGTVIRTHEKTFPSLDIAEDRAEELITELDETGGLTAIGAETWNEYVQFYCIDGSNLPETMPDSMSAAEIVEAMRDGTYTDDVEAAEDFDPSEDADDVLQVDVYPKHETEVMPDES